MILNFNIYYVNPIEYNNKQLNIFFRIRSSNKIYKNLNKKYNNITLSKKTTCIKLISEA